ncbi:amidohydrolase [Halobacteriales archaeon QS_8_69_26]|nr:MAG: amidohydrolase [Halobacteriales archaeon QS_8_69_26]
MTDAADLVLKNGEVHTLAPDGDETHEAVAVRDGRIVRVDRDYEMQFLTGVDTRVVDLEGRVLLPGFIDAHTHVESTGQYIVHADLSDADDREDAVERLRAGARDDLEWILGFGYDESDWPVDRYLTREDLDAVSTDRPVAAIRVDMHTASLNSVALDRLRGEMPDDDVRTEGGEPTGVVVEDAATAVRKTVWPDHREARQLVTAAVDRATELGVTGVHDLVRDSHAPRVYRDLAQEGELDVRVRINYWSDHLDAAVETGLRTNHGGGMVRVGGIKTFTDGSIGSRTAKLSEPYEDADPEADEDPTGQWVVDPGELRDLVDRAHAEGFQVVAHAIGDEAIEAALSAYEAVLDGESGDTSRVQSDPRHRIEHVELATDDQIARMAEAGVVASVQPNFLRWADDGGMYDRCLGRRRREGSNRYREMRDAGVDLAFGSDCMPLDPLLGVDHAVNAPSEAQRLTVTEALRAYTLGAARAGFDEDRLGTVEAGKRADLVVLERSPWEHPESIADIDVALTVVDGRVVHDGR